MKHWIIGATLIASGCASYSRQYPWNFPTKEEWNQPFEASWQNAVDTYRRLTAPKNKVWDPIMRNYQPYLGRDKDGEYQRPIQGDEPLSR